MKKTIIILLTLTGVASAADVQYVDFSGEGTVNAGTTIGNITLSEDMTYGSPSQWYDQFGTTPSVNITGGNFYAGDYTLSLWVDTNSLSTTGNTLLFAYSGSTSSNAQGYNGIMWNGADQTITMGRGNFTANNMNIAWDSTNYSTSSALTLGEGLVNLTFAVSNNGGNHTADIYINGVKTTTLDAYVAKMNGGGAGTQMKYHLNTGVDYGTIGLTNEKLTTAEQVIEFASPTVPEPTTATLSLLALAGLAARRRRK